MLDINKFSSRSSRDCGFVEKWFGARKYKDGDVDKEFGVIPEVSTV